MDKTTRNTSIQPQQTSSLPQVTWDSIDEAGAYVEVGSGDLYRVPKEALVPGASPIIHKESLGASRLFQISKNPYVTTFEARLRCAQQNVEPNF